MTRILFDAFHHMMPGHRIGSEIAVGGYAVNYGRYTPGDCFHPNGLSFLHADLAADGYEIRLLTEPYSDRSLFDADILLAANPDYPVYPKASPYRWTPEDVDALVRFMERGGGVLLLVNSFLSRPDFWEENFDLERVGLLFDRLGVRWDANYMSDDRTIEPGQAGAFRIGYGQGGRVSSALPDGVEPLITYGGNVYGFETRVGRGRLAVVGDAGMMSNGLVCFPGFENAAFFRDLLGRLAPSWASGGAARWRRTRFGHISSAPHPGGITEELLRGLRPEAAWAVDHHYRHLTWSAAESGVDARAWDDVPVSPAECAASGRVEARLGWLRLDADEPGPPCDVTLASTAARGPGGTDLHVIGRTQSGPREWTDVCARPERMAELGTIETLHTVFEMKAALDATGAPRAARWSQSQFLYARNPKSRHYGWEIVITSRNGVLAPAAGE